LLDISVDAPIVEINSAGGAGTHSFRPSSVNTEDNYLYFKNSDAPSGLSDDTTFLYSSGTGSLSGITEGELYYASQLGPQIVELKSDPEESPDDITDYDSGLIFFNTPILYNSQLNIKSSTPTNQAVKYFTNSTPITGLVSGNTYFLKNVAAEFTGFQEIYSFTSHTFTTGGATGRLPASFSQISSSYTGAPWVGQYLSEGDFTGYQDWIVPVSGIYSFKVSGAAGFDGSGAGATGRGAVLEGEISLSAGETITIVAGQRGGPPTSGSIYGGSGGGTFVVRKTGQTPLIVAGGGSANTNVDAIHRRGQDGQLTNRGGNGGQTGQIAGGQNGFGGPAQGGISAGGGGFFGSGVSTNVRVGGSFFNPVTRSEPGGGSFLSGLTQNASNNGSGAGGFGGGGSSDTFYGQSGGAGGYSGGAGASVSLSNFAGGGGGSFVSSSVENLKTSNGTYEDLQTFNSISIINLDEYNSGDGQVEVVLVEAFTGGNEVYPTALDAENGTNRIEIEPAGSSYHSFIPANYDIQNNVIHSPSPHGLEDAQAISFFFEEGTPDISPSVVYYVNLIDPYSYSLTYAPGINFTVPTGRGSLDVVRKIVVNLDLDSLNIPSHGFSVDQPIQYSTGGGNPILPLQNEATYYVSEVIDPNNIRLKIAIDATTNINFTDAGTGTNHSFIFLTVNFTENTLYIPSHGLVTGQVVRYSTNDGTAVGGLTNDQAYFVSRVDDSTIRLYEESQLENLVNLTEVGIGTHSLFIAALNFEENTFTIPQHGFLQGELVEYDSRGQTVINGLQTSQTYYVIFLDGDNIKLATNPQNAEDGIAINIIESPAGVGRHTLTSLSQTPDGIYTILDVPTDDTFTVRARGQVPQLVKPFNPRSTVDIETDSFFLPSHGFVTGTKVLYETGDLGTPIGATYFYEDPSTGNPVEATSLSDGKDYYTVVINQDYFRLAESLDKALSGIKIEILDFGSGVSHSFASDQLNGSIVGSGTVSVETGSVLVNGVGTSFSKILKVGDPFTLYPQNTTKTLNFGDSDVNIGNDRIEISHNFEPGDYVKFNTGGGVAPTPLINNYYYYVGVVDENAIELFTSKSAALILTGGITFSSPGDGASFTLTNTIPVGPIVRRITAVGSDFQVTVDRPYASPYTEVAYAYPTFMYVRPSGYSLHRPFDGGVEMSTGSGNWFGQIIRQTRKYFRYQSGKGIQTSFAINFKPSIDIERMERFSSTQIEVETRRPHNLISGLFITVAEAQDSAKETSTIYNGQFQVSVLDLTTFRITANQPVPTGAEARAYGFPQFHVNSWSNGAIRSGMFDFQNGMFFEFDGQDLYCVRRSSTQQTAGTVSALRGSELIFGDKTKFTAQLEEGDSIVLRGQTYKVIDITDDTTLSVRPEYRGSTGLEITFDPQTQVSLENNSFSIVRHGLSEKLPVVYNSIDGEPLGGLINGRTYYTDFIDANNFKLLANPDSESPVNISSFGTEDLHSFVPAKSGIIVTKTVDTKVPQSEWNIDKCDGTGPSGYNLDLSKIQMCYMDFSWYGAGKIRYGFKVGDGLVKYVHEFKHNNVLFESYFRSGNLPARYEVITFENPTYVPSLFHWGTSVIMDGTFDDDRGYLFTAGSQVLNITGTTTKSFAGNGIDLETDLITSLTHGFRSGDIVQFQSIASDGLPGTDDQNPQTEIVGSNTLPSLTNTAKYGVLVNSPDRIHLTPPGTLVRTFDNTDGGIRTSQSDTVVTVVSANHGLSTDDFVGLYGSSRVPNGAFKITVVDSDTFTYQIHESAEFTTPGTFSWTAPEGVNTVSVVAVGGGGGGGQTSDGSGGGGGGGLGWKRRVSVTPGEEYTVVVGAGGNRDTDTGTGNNATAGGTSYFINASLVSGVGGGPVGQVGGGTVYRRGGQGGGFTGDGGGFGGNGGEHNRNDRGGGGGGAGGYTGNGGVGGGTGAGAVGAGGAAGGGGAGASGLTGGNGGGVGIFGAGVSGSGGALGGNGIGGGGGSRGATGGPGTSSPRNGGLYGGGGGGSDNTSNVNASGGGGAVRIIWGSGLPYPDTGAGTVALENDTGAVFTEVLNFTTTGNTQYTYFLHPDGSLNNTTGPNYQPLISLRLSPSADSGLTGKLGDRDIINRMQVRMQEIGVSTDELVEVKLILNGRLNNLGFTPVDPPSLVELVEHTPQDTISGGVQVYNFQAEAGSTTTLALDALFELSNSILGGDNIFPDGPDILTVAVSRLTGENTRTSAKLSWSEAQA
jgi:hypothetical protein